MQLRAARQAGFDQSKRMNNREEGGRLAAFLSSQACAKEKNLLYSSH